MKLSNINLPQVQRSSVKTSFAKSSHLDFNFKTNVSIEIISTAKENHIENKPQKTTSIRVNQSYSEWLVAARLGFSETEREDDVTLVTWY